MLMFPAKIKPEGRVIVRSRDFHRRYIARMLLFEKPIKHFQKQGFGSMYGIGEFRISPQHSVQVDFLCDHVVAAIQLCRCAQHSERQVREFCNTVTERDMSLQIRQHRLEIGPVLLLALFAPCSCAKLRSEEHTSELQSHSDLVCRHLLEKKKKITLYDIYRRRERSAR